MKKIGSSGKSQHSALKSTAFYDEVTGSVNKGEGMNENMCVIYCYFSKVSNMIFLKIFRDSRGMD